MFVLLFYGQLTWICHKIIITKYYTVPRQSSDILYRTAVGNVVTGSTVSFQKNPSFTLRAVVLKLHFLDVVPNIKVLCG